MLDGEAVIETRLFFLQLFQGIKGRVESQVTIGMDMDMEPCIPPGQQT